MDITNPRLIYFKALLLLLAGLLAAILTVLEHPSLRLALLLAVCIWCFARAYYFVFYVIQHYVDDRYRFAGLWSFARYVLLRKRHNIPPSPASTALATLVRHPDAASRECSTCGWRYRLLSRGDVVAAWAHVVEMDGATAHYHGRGTELYYVLDGDGAIVLNGVEHPLQVGSIVHIPPGVVHGAKGRLRVLVIGIPDISEEDLFYPTAIAR